MKKAVKWTLIVLAILCVVILAVAVIYVLNEGEEEMAPSETPFAWPEYEYVLGRVEDISVADARRDRVFAYISEETESSISDASIKQLMMHIAQEYTVANPVNAVQLMLSVEGDDDKNGASVGYCTYAPYGDIGRSSEVNAGDYEQFEFCDMVVYSKEQRDWLRTEGLNNPDVAARYVNGYCILHGQLLEIEENSGAGMDETVVKVKIQSSYSDAATIDQNYFNVEDLIVNQGAALFGTLSYCAVADMADGSEQKVISFSVDEETIQKIRDGEIVANQMGDFVSDLWVHQDLQ